MTATTTPHRHRRWRRIEEMAFTRHLGKWDSQAYAALVMAGVPLLAYFMPGYSTVKAMIALAWFALVPPLYWFFEGLEIIQQIKRHGLLDAEDTDAQRTTMQFVFWVGSCGATVIGFFLWLKGYAAYGWVEWVIILHTAAMAWMTIKIYYPMMSEFQLLSGRLRRFEEDQARR